jgi:pimeloyl-ACP methyl ester carboxylesterase
MEHVRSADGTRIAMERLGAGDPVIVVGGATCDRARMRPVAEALAAHAGVVNFDRRGRGDSGDTPPYAVAREVEDLAALIDAAGGRAAVYGHSSGAVLGLHAAAAGLPIAALVVHEAPFSPDREPERAEAARFGAELSALLAAGRRGDAVALFFTTVGMPPEAVDAMRAGPGWPALEALAPTLAHDSAVMGDVDRGGTVPHDLLARVEAPTLVLCGGASPDWMLDIGRDVAAALPAGRLEVLAGEEHVVAPDVLAPVVSGFFASIRDGSCR